MKPTILITGASGFIGTRLVNAMKKEKYNVCEVDKKLGSDVTNYKQMDGIFSFFTPNIVVHLAAELSNDLFPNIKDNCYGTYVITKLCKKHKVKKLIFSSSAAVYGNNSNALETDYLRPINFYGMAKKYCEKIIQRFGVPYVILRFSNVYGKDGKGIISKLIEEQTPVITSPQHYTRDFIHALDICNAIIKSLKYRKNNVFNISSSKAISIGVLPIKIGKTIKNSIKHKREIKFSCLNNTKAKKELKWTPKISLEKGIKEYELL